VNRIPDLRYVDLDEDGRAFWEKVIGSRGVNMINEEGTLVGPFSAWLQAPSVGSAAVNLGTAVRFCSSLDRRLSELAIITVGARWKAEFEWWAHSRMALEHGVAASVIDAIGRDIEPVFDASDERTVYWVASQLARTGSLDEDVVALSRAELGDTATVELVTLCGYYTMVSFVLNAFAVPLPAGVRAQWA
jgi:4-carboxymuconolactone decarboxylase